MKTTLLRSLSVAVLLLLAGCRGQAGPAGETGERGLAGTAGPSPEEVKTALLEDPAFRAQIAELLKADGPFREAVRGEPGQAGAPSQAEWDALREAHAATQAQLARLQTRLDGPAFPAGAPRILYVAQAPEGHDENDGLSPEHPKATLDGAWALLPAVVDEPVEIQIKQGPGTYPGGVRLTDRRAVERFGAPLGIRIRGVTTLGPEAADADPSTVQIRCGDPGNYGLAIINVRNLELNNLSVSGCLVGIKLDFAYRVKLRNVAASGNSQFQLLMDHTMGARFEQVTIGNNAIDGLGGMEIMRSDVSTLDLVVVNSSVQILMMSYMSCYHLTVHGAGSTVEVSMLSMTVNCSDKRPGNDYEEGTAYSCGNPVTVNVNVNCEGDGCRDLTVSGSSEWQCDFP